LTAHRFPRIGATCEKNQYFVSDTCGATFSPHVSGGHVDETIKQLVEFAKASRLGWWELVAGISVIVVAFRTPDLLKSGGEFLNERKRINDADRLKREQTQRTIDAARARRTRTGQKK
jgi:hypothetical protein